MQKSSALEKRIDDLTLISAKVDLALNAKNELVRAKEEIIENLKTILALRKHDQPEAEGDNLPALKPSKPGVKECCEFIEVHTSSSAVLNGFLLCADFQRQITPENIWKAQAMKKFLKEDITQAKELLWRVYGVGVLGKMVSRQGTTKTHSEVNDISAAMKVLPAKESYLCFWERVVWFRKLQFTYLIRLMAIVLK